MRGMNIQVEICRFGELADWEVAWDMYSFALRCLCTAPRRPDERHVAWNHLILEPAVTSHID